MRGVYAIVAAASAVGLGLAQAAPIGRVYSCELVEPRPQRQVKRIVAIPVRYRSRWKAARPKRRPNRLHISRRVRRRHRRAAKR